MRASNIRRGVSVLAAAGAALVAFCMLVFAAYPAASMGSEDSAILRVAATSGSGWEAPADKAAVKNPVANDEKSLAAGKVIYPRECASCHGAKGKGNGRMASSCSPRPTDLTSPSVWKQTDGALFWKVSVGRGSMPEYASKLTEEERWHVVNFMHTFAPKSG
jgi:mono/diheme cytochrome c family protein